MVVKFSEDHISLLKRCSGCRKKPREFNWEDGKFSIACNCGKREATCSYEKDENDMRKAVEALIAAWNWGKKPVYD